MKKNLIITVIVIVVVGIGAFFGGIKYQQSKGNSFSNFPGQGGQFKQRVVFDQNQRGQRMGQNFTPVRGNISSVDNNTITVKLQDGSSKIVVLSDSTTYMKESSAAKSDLKTGDTVAVVGNTNSDGTVTAQNVQINPIMRRVTPATR